MLLTLQEELLTEREKAKLLEVRIYETAKVKKLWKPKIKSIIELHSFVKRALHNRDVYHNPLIQTIYQVWRTAGSADLKDVLELTTEYLTLLDKIAVKERVLKNQETNKCQGFIFGQFNTQTHTCFINRHVKVTQAFFCNFFTLHVNITIRIMKPGAREKTTALFLRAK